MRKIKFNKFERVAGLFVLFAIFGVLATAVSVAIKQGWFDYKYHYTTIFDAADGIHQGTIVQMAGLKAGAVESVELQADNKIRIKFYVLERFKERIHQDSVAQLIRPFVIGERTLDISVGSESSPELPDKSEIPSQNSVDFIALLNGKTWNNYLGRVGDLLENMKVLINSFADKGRIEGLVKTLDRMDPLIKNMNTMSIEVIKLSQQATAKDGVRKLVENLEVTTNELNKILPEMNKQNPDLAKNLAQTIQNLNMMMSAMGPAIKSIEPQLPGASSRMVEALNEAVIVLKAMQKNIFMQGSVNEVKEEEALRRASGNKLK